MAFYMDEEEAFKCHKHSSRRRKTGICPKCLRDRLLTLCPECANTRPCACSPIPTDTSSSSSSSSSPARFSLFSFSRGGSRHVTGTTNCSGDACPLPTHHEGDPSLRKSRSVAISFLRSRSRYVETAMNNNNNNINTNNINNNNNNNNPLPPKVSRSKINFWSMFSKSKRSDIVHDDGVVEGMNIKSDDLMVVDEDEDVDNNNNSSMMMRSRSVAVGGGNRLGPASSKHKGWYFPSPINAFRHSKSPLSVTVT